MNMLEDEPNRKNALSVHTFEDGWPDQLSPLPLPVLSIDQMPTQVNLRKISDWAFINEQEVLAGSTIDGMPTWILPVVEVEHIKNAMRRPGKVIRTGGDEYIRFLRNLTKSSGIYALASVALPLISLLLAPFLTRYLSSSDYGIFTILNTLVGLVAGITQLGLASAFFRAYGYDYTAQHDQRAVLATVTGLLFLSSMLVAIGMTIMAPFLAHLLFGRSSLSSLISLTGWIVLLQNLTVPGFAWLRAENRSLHYSLLTISSLLITLIANILLVGGLHWGVTGSLIATGCGYISVLLCTIPVILLRAGIRIRPDIARSLLAFGLPLVLNFVSYWVLQLSDRYLLSFFGSLEQTAKYAVVYTLGSAMGVVVIGPFTLAWPTAMFTIAKRDDAVQVFRLIFRWFSMLLLFAAFTLSFVSTLLLDWLFPVVYHSAATIIPIIAVSIAFYGIYYVFMVGANVTRKTWIAAVFTTAAAIINVAFNLVLIPSYGAMGAAVSTLLAYIVLAVSAYIVNQRIYPIPFEIDIFVVALLLGVALYTGSDYLAHAQGVYMAWSIHIFALCLYGCCLALLGKLWGRGSKNKYP